MRLLLWFGCVAVACFLLGGGPASGSLVLVGGPGLPQTGNLVANGSFENGHPGGPGFANERYWATGTSYTPFLVPPGWSSSGVAATYASWGSDDTGPSFEYRGSDLLPDGQLAVYFGNGLSALDKQPTFNPDGTVSFPSAPTFTPFTGGPAVLSQLVNTQNTPAPSYTLTFWASGEAAGSFSNTEEGIFGFRMTNVLAGDPIQYLTVPAGAGPQGASRYYRYDFVPLNPGNPVTIEFTNWGHIDMTPFGGSATTELLIDDVVIQPVPEPSTAVLAGFGAILLAWRLRRRHARSA